MVSHGCGSAERGALVRRDTGEGEGQDRRPARRAVELERAAQHADALADPDDPQPAALRGAGERSTHLEAVPVVRDADLDRRAPHPETDLDGGGARVLADVRERLLD